MQAIGDIISYIFPFLLIVTLKKAQKSNWGKIYDIFSPCIFIFSPLSHAIIVLLSQTVYWGEKYGKRKIKSYFSRWTQSFFVTVSAYFNWGKIYDIFFPCVFIFSLLGHAINCSTFTGGVLGKNILSLSVYVFPLCPCFFPWLCCMVFTLPSFLDSFLDMSLIYNIIFSPLVHFFSYL
jgi:hypothetical protein